MNPFKRKILRTWSRALIITAFFAGVALPIHAHDHYSYELAEELTPLIAWYDYGPEAFDVAVRENKPIFLLLTAPSWCYWCQVYESDEYLFNDAVYPYINENFVPVYVDADKRQDLTRQYLEGGWPSTTVMAPNGERLYGFSGPRDPSTMLANLGRAVDFVATTGFSNLNATQYVKEDPVVPVESELLRMQSGFVSTARASFDPVYGGFGLSRKFPQALTLDYLLDVYDRNGDRTLLDIVEQTMEGEYTDIATIATDYNLFDPIEGGFHRYGTVRDYTPPHYEKMLYDNAKALKAYAHLRQVSDNVKVDEVVEKTLAFMDEKFYDRENGGFFANVDAFEEDEYYGAVDRSAEKPRVEQTKYADWNALAVLTYLDLGRRFDDSTYTGIATATLDWFSDTLVSEKGAFHYVSPDGDRGITGNILDNAYLTLAFIQGFEATDNIAYLERAEALGEYALDTLYDWDGGGFFERNSTDTEKYAPQELVIFAKPAEENGVMALAMAKLYLATSDIRFLNATIKTVGRFSGDVGYLDSGYFLAMASRIVTDEKLLQEYRRNEKGIVQLEQAAQEVFWARSFSQGAESSGKPGFQPVDISVPLQGSVLLLLIISFAAGLLSLLSPCTLPILPAYLAGVFTAGKRFRISLAIGFFLGLVSVFTALGMSASALGGFLRDNLVLFSRIAGVVLVGMGILIGLGKGFSGLKITPRRPTSFRSAVGFGGILAFAWTPCVGPILASVLVLASTVDTMLVGGSLLFMYGVGLTLPLILLSGVVLRLDRKGRFWRFIEGREINIRIRRRSFTFHTTSLLAGALMLALGLLMFSGSLTSLNRLVGVSGVQKFLYGLEDTLMIR